MLDDYLSTFRFNGNFEIALLRPNGSAYSGTPVTLSVLSVLNPSTTVALAAGYAYTFNFADDF